MLTGNLRTVIRPRPSRTHTRVSASSAVRPGRRWGLLAARRTLTVVVLSLFAVPVFAVAASAQEVGTRYDPDPLSPLEAWGIYGGTIVGGFLTAAVLTALSSRKNGPTRYRPGQPWEHDEVWLGAKPEEIVGGSEPRSALPGAGGASGTW